MTRPIIAALGDSLTVGEHVDGTPLHVHPWPALLDVALFPTTGIGQFGLGGDVVANMKVRFDSFIKGFGFSGLILWGGVNDIVADSSALAIWASMESLIDEALLEGLGVVLVVTPGFGAYSGWTSDRQTQFDALRVLMNAKADVTHVDLFQPAPVGLNDPDNPLNLLPGYRISDGLHINPMGAAHVVSILSPILRELYPMQPLAPVKAAGGGLIVDVPGGDLGKAFVKTGDLVPLRLQVLTGDMEPVSLVGVEVTFSMRTLAGNVSVSSRACTVVDAAAGMLEYPWDLGETDAEGHFLGELHLAFANGPQNAPSKNYISITIDDSMV